MIPKTLMVAPGKKYFDFNLKFLCIVGLWPNDEWSHIKLKLYNMYEMNVHMLAVIYLIITAIGTYTTKDDAEAFIGNMDKTVIGYCVFAKVMCFVINKKAIQILVNDVIYSGDKISLKCQKRMISHLIFVSGLILATVSTFSLSAVYDGEMTVEAWMPFNPKKSKQHILMAAQLLAVLFVVPIAMRSAGLQGIICSFIMYFCEQLQELQFRIRALEYHPENDSAVREEFKEIVKKHVRLIDYAQTFENSLTSFFLVHNLSMTVEMCLNALMVSSIGTEEKKTLINFMAFLSIALINTYIFCYMGNEMIIQSEGVCQAAYESPWTSWPLDMQKDLLTVITVAQRPLKLSAGGLSLVSLQTYGQILYNGYSIFTMLHDMM